MSNQAYEIQDSYNKCKDSSLLKVPSVSVFLDEINTASCLGLFKEIIVDKSIDGTVSTCTVHLQCTCMHFNKYACISMVCLYLVLIHVLYMCTCIYTPFNFLLFSY